MNTVDYEEKGAIPSETVENGVSNSLIHPAPTGVGRSDKARKEIEEMALELCRPRNIVKMMHRRTCGNCDTSSCDIYELCVDLYNAGYRKQSELTPCDCCKFNPPTSGDGKPCFMCPAQSTGGEA